MLAGGVGVEEPDEDALLEELGALLGIDEVSMGHCLKKEADYVLPYYSNFMFTLTRVSINLLRSLLIY